jgi:hypothetical protein
LAELISSAVRDGSAILMPKERQNKYSNYQRQDHEKQILLTKPFNLSFST